MEPSNTATRIADLAIAAHERSRATVGSTDPNFIAKATADTMMAFEEYGRECVAKWTRENVVTIEMAENLDHRFKEASELSDFVRNGPIGTKFGRDLMNAATKFEVAPVPGNDVLQVRLSARVVTPR